MARRQLKQNGRGRGKPPGNKRRLEDFPAPMPPDKIRKQGDVYDDVTFSRSLKISRVSVFLLHRNQSDNTLQKYNPFYTINVNARSQINMSRLAAWSENLDERKNNIVFQLCTSKGSADNPLRQNTYFVVGSFVDSQFPTSSNTKLFLADQDSSTESSSSLHAVPLSLDVIKSALSWLCQDKIDVEKVTNINDGFSTFLRELDIFRLPNSQYHELLDFIKNREWSGTLFGGEPKQFLQSLSNEENHCRRWQLVRRYITFNMAWQTKVLCFPLDCLHRSAVSSTVYNGIPPPQSNVELTELVKNFAAALDPETLFNDFTTDCLVVTGFYIPTELDENYCNSMMDLSATTQTDNARQVSHTVIDILLIILKSIDLEMKYLLDGVSQIYNKIQSDGTDDKYQMDVDDFKSLLKSDFKDLDDKELDGIIAETKVANLSNVERCERFAQPEEDRTPITDLSFPNNSGLADMYIKIWVYTFSKRLYVYLKNFCARLPNVSKIDGDVGLDKIVDMKCGEFQQMFRTGDNMKEGSYPSYMLSPYTDKKALNVLTGSGNFGELFSGSIFLRKWKKVKVRAFNGYLLDMVWILLYSQLSKSSNKSILLFLCPPGDKVMFAQHASDHKDVQERSRRIVRCLHLTINQSTNASKDVWAAGFFSRDQAKSASCRLPRTMRSVSQYFLLLLSSIVHSCKHFVTLGHNPARSSASSGNIVPQDLEHLIRPDNYSESESNDTPPRKFYMTESQSDSIVDLIQDEIVKATLNFMIRIGSNEEIVRKWEFEYAAMPPKESRPIKRKGWYELIVSSSMRDITNLQVELELDDATGMGNGLVEYSRDGRRSMTMEWDSQSSTEGSYVYPADHESIVQVFGRDEETTFSIGPDICSHRIGDVVKKEFDWKSLLDLRRVAQEKKERKAAKKKKNEETGTNNDFGQLGGIGASGGSNPINQAGEGAIIGCDGSVETQQKVQTDTPTLDEANVPEADTGAEEKDSPASDDDCSSTSTTPTKNDDKPIEKSAKQKRKRKPNVPKLGTSKVGKNFAAILGRRLDATYNLLFGKEGNNSKELQDVHTADDKDKERQQISELSSHLSTEYFESSQLFRT